MGQSSQAIAHNWANQTTKGPRKTRNFYREGDTVYSYGDHFPVATHLTNNIVLFNREESSRTTSEHQKEVEMAIPAGKTVIKVHTSLIKAVINPWGEVNIWDHTSKGRSQRMIVHVRREFERVISNIKHYQKQHARAKKRSYVLEIEYELRYLQLIYRNIPFDRRKLDKTQRYYLRVAVNDLLESEDIQREVEAEKNIQKERTQQEIKAFRNFQRPNVQNSDKTYLRLNIEDRQVETSRGVRVDLNEALAVAEVCRKAKGKNRPANVGFPVARWWVESITSNGSLHAGCHVISWSEIKRILETAEEYGLDRETLEISER